MKELFLLCALSLPPVMIPQHNRFYDVGIFRFMVQHYRKFHEDKTDKDDRAYLIGGAKDLLLRMRQSGIETWRVTIDPHTPFDIVAYPNAIPLARESSLVVIFMLEVNQDPWGSMKLWAEATMTLCPDGLIAFYERWSLHFPRLAKAQGFERLPFDWYNMQVWRKPRRVYGGGGRGEIRAFERYGQRSSA